MDYRSWLQQQANSHADSNTRKQASAVLQRVGDDQRLDDGWMNNPLAAVFDRTNGYGKQSVINMNDNFKNMYTADMNRIADSPIVYANNGNTQPQTPNQQWAVGTGG